jgi:hypothetical protein
MTSLNAAGSAAEEKVNEIVVPSSSGEKFYRIVRFFFKKFRFFSALPVVNDIIKCGWICRRRKSERNCCTVL